MGLTSRCVVTLQCFLLISGLTADISEVHKEKYLNCLIDYLNNLPDQPYTYEDGLLINAQEIAPNIYQIEANIKVSELQNPKKFKLLKCRGRIGDNKDFGTEVIEDNYHCQEDDVPSGNTENTGIPDTEITGTLDTEATGILDTEIIQDDFGQATEAIFVQRPVRLDNEVQSDNAATSGEQFIAIPRVSPTAPCIGCASYVDVSAPGVRELAILAVRHLDRHESNVKHTLATIISVERQVQAVNGVRFILNLKINYNNCTPEEINDCDGQKSCKVAILEKPWLKLSDGSKFRAIVSNNCTNEWLFGDNGEVLPTIPENSQENKDNNEIDVNPSNNIVQNNSDKDNIKIPNHDHDKIANTGSADDILKVIHETELQQQLPIKEKYLTEDQLKNLEEQIISKNEFAQQTESIRLSTFTESLNINQETISKQEAKNNLKENEEYSEKDTHKVINKDHSTLRPSSSLSDDKKHAIDDLLSFFDLDPKLPTLSHPNSESQVNSRSKRNYDYDLHLYSKAERYRKLKRNIDNAGYIYFVAQAMVDYLNEMDLQVKNRVLKEVIKAEEENENYQQFIYVQAHVTTTCDKVECNDKDMHSLICNAVIESTKRESPQILSAFCNDEEDNKQHLGKIIPVSINDPIIAKYSTDALKKIEAESTYQYGLRILKILDANTQILSGSLTKISLEIGFIDCNTSIPLVQRTNCKNLGHLGTKLCSVTIHNRAWLTELGIEYSCTDRPEDEIFNNFIGAPKQYNINDSKVLELAEESLQYLILDNEKNSKLKVVNITSVSTQLVAGLLTHIKFQLGFTKCPDEINIDSKSCELLEDEPLRNCSAHIWDRPWLEEGKLVNVTCEPTKDTVTNYSNMDEVYRSKRSNNFVGGPIEQDPNKIEYKNLAQEALTKYQTQQGNGKEHKIIEVTHVTTQVVAGIRTKIQFKISDLQDNSNVFICNTDIWDRSWLPDGKQIEITCTNVIEKNKDDDPNSLKREKRSGLGGVEEQNVNDEYFKVLAKEAVQQFQLLSNTQYIHRIVKINRVTSQRVSGLLIKIDFQISPTQCYVNDVQIDDNCQIINEDSVLHCHSEILERIWLPNPKQITVNCKNDDEPKDSSKDNLPGGIIDHNTTLNKYMIMAQESLQKYYQLSKSRYVHKILKLEKVTSQLVAGTMTRIDFKISPTDCLVQELRSESECTIENPDVVLHCHSEIWDRPWLADGKNIEIECQKVNVSENTEFKFQKKRSPPGGIMDKDPNKKEYIILAQESLHKYNSLIDSQYTYKIIKVNRVTEQIVQGTLTKVYFTISPTNCLIADMSIFNDTNCQLQNAENLTNCVSEIWERSWLSDPRQITVNCDNKTEQLKKQNLQGSRKKRSLLGGDNIENSNKQIYRTLAAEALKKFESVSDSEYAHKIMKINRVTTKIVSGKTTKIDFTVSQTICAPNDLSISARDECSLQIPNVERHCLAEVWDRPWMKKKNKEITVNCQMKQNKKVKRQAKVEEEDFIDEETKFLYAERAVQMLNINSNTNNLYKIVTVYAMQSTYQMNTLMVRMYIEVVLTYCTKDNKPSNLDRCDEIEGAVHRTCLARLWPSTYDELILEQVNVVCDDDDNFEAITGISTDDFINTAIKELEKSPKVKNKIIALGQPKIIPSLDTTQPIKLSFMITSLDCPKTIDRAKIIKDCHMDVQRPTRECHAYIWLVSNLKKIDVIKVACRAEMSRVRRSISLTNASSAEDFEINDMVQQSIQKLEGATIHRYKQRLLRINSHSTEITSGRLTTIDFDVAYTSCLKYEWIEDIKTCEFMEHLPRRHCVSKVLRGLWVNNGYNIEVSCDDDETPLEAHIEFENADATTELAEDALKHIEAKYPFPYKLKVIRIFSLEKQVVAGLHYRMKMEVGNTDCPALTVRRDCNVTNELGMNRFCRVNVWIKPWVSYAANFRVSCDYQESTTAEIYHQVQAEHLFREFIMTYKPEYIDDYTEMKKRFKIFKDNVKKIHDFNTHEKGSARYAVTRFADLSYEEFRTKYTGLKPSLHNENQIPMPKAVIPKIKLPQKFDWRDKGAVTGVKDQGSCGSCWAFSVTGNIEGQWQLETGKLVSLSEQELVDCDKLDEGCNGGLPDNAYRAIESLGGLETEEDYPYEGEDDKCSFNKTLSKVQISGAVNISSNETDMAQWLVKHGPISIGINANAMQFYVGGVSHPWKMLCDPKNLDHGVLIVGYGIKDYPLFNKRMPYWIVKNSWGTSWGEQGYYRVYRGDGTCGLNQMASSAVV